MQPLQTNMTNNKEEYVILVDEWDHPLGTMEKMEAHELGELHRAFSVFIFNNKDELMLQQRALSKYHSPGLWTNTCCSHPREGEDHHSDLRRGGVGADPDRGHRRRHPGRRPAAPVRPPLQPPGRPREDDQP